MTPAETDADRPGPPDHDATDVELLAAHVGGDPDAFGALVGRHRDRLWAVALRTMRSPEEAADALQDAYVSAFRSAASFRGDAAVTTWLHRIVVNACLDRIRRAKVRSTEPWPDDPDRELRPRSGTTTDPADPADEVIAAERRAGLLQALHRLDPDQRIALVLVDLERLSITEAAAILNCPPGTVKSRCARGRARLVPLLAHLNLSDATVRPTPVTTGTAPMTQMNSLNSTDLPTPTNRRGLR